MDIKPKGDPHSPVWVITEQPYPNDKDKGYVFSSGYGYVFDEMMHDVGIKDYYVIARKPDLNDKFSCTEVFSWLNHYKPPIVIPLEETGRQFCKELNPLRQPKKKKGIEIPQHILDASSDIEKYCGSLLTCDQLKYPHYVIPTYTPETISRHWDQRDVVTYLDLGKAASELTYYKQYGVLEPLKARKLVSDDISFAEILGYIDYFKRCNLLSNDIETVYPKARGNKKSFFTGHPGYPIVIGLADSDVFGISINLFRESVKETVKLWQELQWLFLNIPTLGQNFLIFDIHLYHMLGFILPAENVQDTLFRQHILWPALPKSLQFMTRQYTRQPYYKDEGKSWSMKQLKSLKHYNCLDVCVTFEVYNAQEKEFMQKPHLL